MSFLVSPGVHVNEIDLTNVVPAVDTTIGAIAGPFQKGPVSSIVDIGNEDDLVRVFGKPQSDNFEFFFTAANFLKYSSNLKVVRAESAIVNAGANSGILIRDTDHYLNSFSTGQGSHGEWAARTAGTWGNSIRVEICAEADAYEQITSSSVLTVTEDAVGSTTIAVDDVDASGETFNVGDLISFYSDSAAATPVDERNEYEVTAIDTSANTLTIRLKDDPNGAGLQNIVPDNSYIKRRWKYYDLFDGPPGTSQWATDNARGSNDELHVVVADATGDHQWIHIDPERTKSELNMPTIAHGFLTLSLVPMLTSKISSIKSVTRGINYGTNKVRFTNMVPVNSKVRAKTKLLEAQSKAGGTQLISEVSIEIEGQDRPAMIAETVSIVFE